MFCSQHTLLAAGTFDICILIPCYNNFSGLIKAMDSIVYDAGKYIIIVVDDGSEIAITAEEIEKNLASFADFRVIRIQQNSGITTALNTGLEFIYKSLDVRFIARLDCGDICSPERFYKQAAYLKNHPDIFLLGAWCVFADENSGTSYQYITPTKYENIKRSMAFRNVFIHPTVMWRFEKTDKLKYPQNYTHAEDYGLFYDIISKRKAAILDSFLVVCQINYSGISISNRAKQMEGRLKVIRDYSTNKFLLIAGTIKLKLLMVVPHGFLLFIKKKLSVANTCARLFSFNLFL